MRVRAGLAGDLHRETKAEADPEEGREQPSPGDIREALDSAESEASRFEPWIQPYQKSDFQGWVQIQFPVWVFCHLKPRVLMNIILNCESKGHFLKCGTLEVGFLRL